MCVPVGYFFFGFKGEFVSVTLDVMWTLLASYHLPRQ